MDNDLKIIKKMYGEKMMHLCRELFSTLLETYGLLSKLMLDNFAPSKFLYDDIIESNNLEKFKDYIYSLVDVEKKEIKTKENIKTPKELLEEAGYDLYECKSEKDIQSFKKYYSKGEELCTFNGGRLNNCYVYFAVKKNVDEIKRENFKNPERQDEYGTSVISIQFTRGDTNTLSIKNRYNHRVNNPDATFSNNLENIIEGLTDSFSRTYNLNINQNDNKGFELPNYVKANDGKYYKYNYEIDNVYYCPNNIIIKNFSVNEFPREKYIVLDVYVLDLVNKKIELYDTRIEDSFIDGIKEIKQIDINRLNESENKRIEIITESNNKIIIDIDKTNQIVGYINNELKEVGFGFMYNNKTLAYLKADNLEKTDIGFLYRNKALTELDLPNLKEARSLFLYCNENIIRVNLSNLTYAGASMFRSNQKLISLNLPKLLYAEENFLFSNTCLQELNVPNLIKTHANFLFANEELKFININSLESVWSGFLFNNTFLEEINAPKLESVGPYFLYSNKCLKRLNAPSLKKANVGFMYKNQNLEILELPNLEFVSNGFLSKNYRLQHVYVPKLESVGQNFLSSANKVKYLNAPNLRTIGDSFLFNNNDLVLYAPNLSKIDQRRLSCRFNIVNEEIKIDEESKKKL